MALSDNPRNLFGFTTASSTGNTAVVAAQTNNKIRVHAVLVVSTLANSIKFQSASTDKTALFPVGATGGFVLPYNPAGWFETAVNEALNINMSTATSTGVQVTYTLVQ